VAPPAAAPGKKQNGKGVDIEWDDEELATNIYDAPQDAGDSVVEDKPDLSNVELSDDGSPVPHASAMPVPPPGAAPKPTPHELASIPTAVGQKPRNGTGQKANPFDFVLPEPAAPAAPAFDAPSATGPRIRPRASSGSRALIYGGAVGVAVLLVGAALFFYNYFVGSRPGDVTILSDPATNVQVMLDNKRVADSKGQAIDGTPAVVPLNPGSYVLTVQREGYVPWNEQVELKAGEHLTVRAKLEPLASTGFTLVSEPAGATAVLDGHPLDGLTPLRVESMLPGKHHIELRHAAGNWQEDVTVEAGKMLDLHAVLGAVAAVNPPKPAAIPPAPPPPIAKAPEPKPVKAVEKEPPAPKPAKVEREKPVVDKEPVKKAVALPKPPKDEPKPKVASKKPAADTDDDDDSNIPPPTKSAKAAAAKPEPKPVTPPPPATKPAGSGEGYLRLGSKPWTNISVDGKDTGLHTPQTKIKLSTGAHRITLSNPQFNIKETFSVDIKPGETETVIKDLRPANNDDSD
jgi:hypothetical protein